MCEVKVLSKVIKSYEKDKSRAKILILQSK